MGRTENCQGCVQAVYLHYLLPTACSWASFVHKVTFLQNRGCYPPVMTLEATTLPQITSNVPKLTRGVAVKMKEMRKRTFISRDTNVTLTFISRDTIGFGFWFFPLEMYNSNSYNSAYHKSLIQ